MRRERARLNEANSDLLNESDWVVVKLVEWDVVLLQQPHHQHKKDAILEL